MSQGTPEGSVNQLDQGSRDAEGSELLVELEELLQSLLKSVGLEAVTEHERELAKILGISEENFEGWLEANRRAALARDLRSRIKHMESPRSLRSSVQSVSKPVSAVVPKRVDGYVLESGD